MRVGGRGSGLIARALGRQFSKPGSGGTVCMGTMFWWEECHRGVTMGGWGVTVGDWGVTMGAVATVVDITVGKIDVTDGTMGVTVEGWFITVVGAWWGKFAKQGGQTHHPRHPGKTWT